MMKAFLRVSWRLSPGGLRVYWRSFIWILISTLHVFHESRHSQSKAESDILFSSAEEIGCWSFCTELPQWIYISLVWDLCHGRTVGSSTLISQILLKVEFCHSVSLNTVCNVRHPFWNRSCRLCFENASHPSENWNSDEGRYPRITAVWQ